jgi:hypothetical protein
MYRCLDGDFRQGAAMSRGAQVTQRALRAALLGREIELIRCLIESQNEAAMKAAIQVWAYGEQSEIRLPMRLWRMPSP